MAEQQSLREQRRELRRALSRDQVLDAAEYVFARNGFRDASLREIAEQAEFSVGTVYSLFASKEELYTEIILRRAGEFMPGMDEVLGSSAAPLQQLLDLAAWQVSFFRQYPDYGRVVLRSGAITSPLATPAEDERVRHNFAAAQQAQAEVFRRGQAAGELRPGPPAVLARMFSGLVSAFQAADLGSADSARAGDADSAGAGDADSAGAGDADSAGAGDADAALDLAGLLAVIEAAFSAR